MNHISLVGHSLYDTLAEFSEAELALSGGQVRECRRPDPALGAACRLFVDCREHEQLLAQSGQVDILLVEHGEGGKCFPAPAPYVRGRAVLAGSRKPAAE